MTNYVKIQLKSELLLSWKGFKKSFELFSGSKYPVTKEGNYYYAQG